MPAETPNAKLETECDFRLLAESIPQIIWTAVPGAGIDYFNPRFYDLTGLTPQDALGWEWQKILHPDDLPLAMQNWKNSRETGMAYDVEYRLRTAAGDFRWHLCRAVPLRDSNGVIVKWYGSCTDIDDQMQHEQELENQIKKHVEALMDTNSRLQSEMQERALVQQELNLQSERMLQELTERSNRSISLAKTAELLQGSTNVNDACSVLAGMAPRIFPEFCGAVLLLNDSRELLEVAGKWSGCSLPANAFGPQDCWALRTGHEHVVLAGDHTAECSHVPAEHGLYICLPLSAHGDLIGVLHFQTIKGDELTDSTLAVAHMFAEQVALCILNLRLHEALRNQSIRDPLTGLYNRRYLQEMMERETRRAVRAEHGLGMLMLDLDHFKRFNDTFGHDAGDTVLRETAAFLLKSVRAEDIVCRFGGEEFVVILPAADLRVAQARADRIRSRLRELPVMHQGRSLGMVTVSIGVAELPEHGTTPEQLLEAADAALYRAKREGRDRVVVAQSQSLEQIAANAAQAAYSQKQNAQP